MPKPIIYLTFANQDDDHLPLLKEEINELKRILRPLESREFIQVLTDESATTDEIVDALSSHPNRMAIFHFGGHAGQALLHLESGDAHSKGLSQLLGEQAGLKLVFLNGCSTHGQVQQLLDAGVTAVIATSVPINDSRAVAFASAFYQALAGKRTLRGAFEFARNTLETKFEEAPPLQIVRGTLPASPAEEQELPWGLYLQAAAADEMLDWRLPYYREVGLPQDMIQYIGKSFQLNRYIVLVLDEMCRYNKDIYSQMVEMRDGEEVKKDSSTYLDLVIQNFPWVIGSQIQLLRQHSHPDKERLDQILSTYIITSMVLFYILLNDTWDDVHRYRQRVPGGFLESFRQTRDSLLSIDFLDRLLTLRHIMEQNGCRLFAPEMENLCRELQSDTHLRKAWRHLESLRTTPPTSDLEKACLTAEQALAVVLKFAAFLADYRMLTIRNISIDNPRYSEVAYELNLGALNAIVNTSLSLYEDADKRRKQSFSNCRSIVLSPTERDLDNALNLSPFIIDKNTFLNKNHIDLFLFGFEEEDKYYYFAVKHNIFIALANEKGTDIIHTGMTLEDFQEGRNITHQQQTEDDFGFGDAFGLSPDTTATEVSPKVFPMLETQFAQFKSDFS